VSISTKALVDIKYNEASSKLREQKNMLEFANAMYVRYQKKCPEKGKNKDRKRKVGFMHSIQKYYEPAVTPERVYREY